MAASGRRARGLRWLLELAGFDVSAPTVPLPTWEGVRAAGLADAVEDVYRKLGGTRSEPRIQPGPWDLAADGVPLELDEELHFNRYRALTLAASSYRLLSGFDRVTYMRWCLDREPECLSASWSGRWTNDSAECEFGRAAPVGQLDTPGGAPRWKQRAFYDFVKDLTPLTTSAAVARLSIYDRLSVDGTPIEAHTLLNHTAQDESARAAAEAIASWVAARTFAR